MRVEKPKVHDAEVGMPPLAFTFSSSVDPVASAFQATAPGRS